MSKKAYFIGPKRSRTAFKMKCPPRTEVVHIDKPEAIRYIPGRATVYTVSDCIRRVQLRTDCLKRGDLQLVEWRGEPVNDSIR